MFIVHWRDKRSGLSHGVMPGVFVDRGVAKRVAMTLSSRDISLDFYIEELPIITSESGADSWLALRNQGRKSQ